MAKERTEMSSKMLKPFPGKWEVCVSVHAPFAIKFLMKNEKAPVGENEKALTHNLIQSNNEGVQWNYFFVFIKSVLC